MAGKQRKRQQEQKQKADDKVKAVKERREVKVAYMCFLLDKARTLPGSKTTYLIAKPHPSEGWVATADDGQVCMLQRWSPGRLITSQDLDAEIWMS